jgi:hypothetical protein
MDLLKENKAAEDDLKNQLMAYRQHMMEMSGQPSKTTNVYQNMLNEKAAVKEPMEDKKDMGPAKESMWKALAAKSMSMKK